MTRPHVLWVVLAALAAAAAAYRAALANGTAPARVDVELAPVADVRGTLSPLADAAVLRYAAGADTQLTFRIDASPARKTDLDVHLIGPGDVEVPLVGVPGYADRGAHVTLSRFAVPAAGEYALRVGGTGAATWRLRWTAQPGGGAKQKLDLRSTKLARAAGAEAAAGRIAAGGAPTALAIDAAASDLAGTRLEVPDGAVPAAMRLLVTSAAVPAASAGAGRRLAGPAADIGPAGLVLTAPATLTVPYDPYLVPPGADPFAVLRVARVEGDGTATSLVPDDVDTDAHTVTVSTDRLSRFVATAPAGAPDPSGEDLWTVGFEAHLGPGDGGGGARDRVVSLDRGRAAFAADGSMTWTGDRYEVAWTHDDSGIGIVTPDSAAGVTSDMTWQAEGRRISVTDPGGGGGVLEPSADGEVFVSQVGDATATPVCALRLAVRRGRRVPTRAALAGTWTVGAIESEVWEEEGRGAGITLARTSAAVTLREDGTWSVKGDVKGRRFDPSRETVRPFTARLRQSGVWSVVTASGDWSEGAVSLVTQGADGGPPILLFPSADGTAVIGASQSVVDGNLVVLVGLRRASGLSAKDVAGDFAAGAVSMGLGTAGIDGPAAKAAAFRFCGCWPGGPRVPAEDRSGPPWTIGDIGCGQADALMRFDGTSKLRIVSGGEKDVHADPGSPGGINVSWGTDVPGGPLRFRLARDGRMTVVVGRDEQVAGAVRGDGLVGFVVEAAKTSDGRVGLRVFVKSP